MFVNVGDGYVKGMEGIGDGSSVCIGSGREGGGKGMVYINLCGKSKGFGIDGWAALG